MNPFRARLNPPILQTACIARPARENVLSTISAGLFLKVQAARATRGCNSSLRGLFVFLAGQTREDALQSSVKTGGVNYANRVGDGPV
jgi:hypothetical protein